MREEILNFEFKIFYEMSGDMWNDLLIAVGFLLVLEGIMPFLSPQHWRITMVKLVEHSDQVLRVMGLTSMVIGAIVIYVVRRKLLPF